MDINTTVLTSLKLGAGVSISSMFLTNVDLQMAMLIGSVGGLASFFYEYAHIEHEDKGHNFLMRSIAELFVAIVLSISIALSVIMGGTKWATQTFGDTGTLALYGIGISLAFYRKSVLTWVAKQVQRMKI